MRHFAALALVSFLLQGAFAHALTVTSNTIKNGGKVPEEQAFNGMGCKGQNTSPDLKWTGAPKDTKYYAVTVYDPDAPTGSGWWHWVAFNIPATTTSLAKNFGASMDDTSGVVQSRTDFGKGGYGGPCPPVGDKPHHYHFKVYALKDKVPLDKDSPAAMVGFYIHSLKIGEGELTATYGR